LAVKADTMENKLEISHEATNSGTIRYLFRLIGVVIIALLLLWLAFWQGIMFEEYKWVYSENVVVKAWQYLLYWLWAFLFAFSPLWVIGGFLLSVKLLLLKK